jgi:hypothetical protein
MPKKSMIPAAYIFTDTVPERFISSYTSLIYEEFTFLEALRANPKKLPNLYNACHVVNLAQITTPNTLVFVIYNPNPKRLTMAQFGDVDKLKVLVDSVQRQNLLAGYARAFNRLLNTAHAFQYFDEEFQNLNLNKTSKDRRAKLSRSLILQSNSVTIQHLDVLRQLLIDSFKKDLCF